MTKMKNELKIVKGTKINFWCRTRNGEESKTIVLDNDCTEENLDDMAKEFLFKNNELDFSWEIVE